MRNIFACRKSNIAIAALAAVIAIASSASAESLLQYATRSGNANNSTTHVLAPLTDSQATFLTFSTTAANKVVKITYNAECGVLGIYPSWQSVTVLVDGVEASPASNTAFAFCTATSTTNFTWTGAVRQSLIKVPAKGLHTVQIVIDLDGSATEWWLGDSSLVVEQQ